MTPNSCAPHPISRDRTRAALFLAVALVASSSLPAAAADEEQNQPRKPLTGVSTNCADCGVVRGIRELRTEREAPRPDTYVSSPQYRDTLPADLPRIGPAISMTWGKNSPPRTQIGAFGTPEMKHRYIDITYEISVRFDDGRFGLIEQDDPDDLRVGDRVILVKRRLEKVTD